MLNTWAWSQNGEKMKVLFAILCLSGVAQAQCYNGVCPPVMYNQPYYQAAPTHVGLHYTLVNEGVEKSRFNVKVKVYNRIYNIPVINGNLPEISQKNGNPNDLILDYSAQISYTNKYGGEYISYESIATAAKKGNKPTAVKNFDDSKTEQKADLPKKKGPSGLKRPENLKLKDITRDLNDAKKAEIPAPFGGRQSPDRDSDEEIDNLLKRPSLPR